MSQPTLRMPKWETLQKRVSYPLVRPTWVIRPAPPVPSSEPRNFDNDNKSGTEDEVYGSYKEKQLQAILMRKDIILQIFSRLPVNSLLTAMRVCFQWSKWAIDPSLWQSLSLARKKIDTVHLHGIARRQPSKLILDWCEITSSQFSWLLARLPQMYNLHCEGLSWSIIHPLVSPYCPPLTELDISFCEGIDDETISALLRPPPVNRPGFRDSVSRLRQLISLKLGSTHISDIGVSLIVRSLPFLAHLDISGCLRITNSSLEFLVHSSSVVSHSLKSLDIRGCDNLTPLILPMLVQLPNLSWLAVDPCELIPLKAIKVWGTSHAYSFNEENIMTRLISKSDVLPIDTISYCEAEVLLKRKKASKSPESRFSNILVIENFHSKSTEIQTLDNSSPNENISKMPTNENSSKMPLNESTSKMPQKPAQTSVSEYKKSLNNKTFIEKEADIAHIIVSTQLENIESAHLKCVITPLEKDEKNHNTNKSQESSNIFKKKSISLEDGELACTERKSLTSCRRSERSNKGKKYKLNFPKRKNSDDNFLQKSSMVGSEKKNLKISTEDISVKIAKKSLKTICSQKNHPKEPFKSCMKQKGSKNIITRSKKWKGEEVCSVSKSEYEVVQKPFIKSTKDHKSLRDSLSEKVTGTETEENLKVRIALKSGPQYSSKLRKKSKEDENFSSSSPETKATSAEYKSETRHHLLKQDDSVKTPKLQNETHSDVVQNCSTRRRKERKGSSSSSSSSPSSSPCLPLSKKLKVELKPITKIGRRKSDVIKCEDNTVTIATNSKLESGGSSSGLSGRERPERHHRSPRRLSMCQ